MVLGLEYEGNMLYVGAHRYVHEIQTHELEKQSIERQKKKKKRLCSNHNIVSSLKRSFRNSILAEILIWEGNRFGFAQKFL